ncbi:zf-HC2 domain-containing protein [Ruminococcaceae bacterium OttesenSCG-928-D13]|nr:zf-HC2 domain-containing protein [Ruminococcaceae bacterium OttesenSCG-928-D13]
MMELFHEDGHLTDAGLAALIDGGLDELERLEVAEHLSFCDKCLVRYTALLTDEVLLTPETPQKPKVMKRLRSRTWKVRVGRYATVAAAACLAVVMWAVGSFAAPRIGRDDTRQPAQTQTAQDTGTVAAGAAAAGQTGDVGILGHIDNFLDNTFDSVNGFLDRIGSGQSGASEREKQREAERKEAERKAKEQVFSQRSPVQQPDDNSGASNG